MPRTRLDEQTRDHRRKQKARQKLKADIAMTGARIGAWKALLEARMRRG